MTPIQYFTEHHKVILEAYDRAKGQIKQTWDTLLVTLPGLAEAMSRNSFKAYLPAFAAGFQVAMQEVKQVKQADIAETVPVKHKLNNSEPKFTRQAKELEAVKQRLNIRESEIADLTKKLTATETELNTVKQLFSGAQVKHTLNNSGLPKVKQANEETPKTIAGWSVQLSGGYYRAFRKIAGKVEGVYIGRVFDADKARSKIATKEAMLTGGRTETSTKERGACNP